MAAETVTRTLHQRKLISPPKFLVKEGCVHYETEVGSMVRGGVSLSGSGHLRGSVSLRGGAARGRWVLKSRGHSYRVSALSASAENGGPNGQDATRN